MRKISTFKTLSMRATMMMLLAVITSVGVWAEDAISVTSSTTAMTDGTYKVTSNVTISERIQISGTVNLILGEGATLTAKDGIEVPTGATLIIDGAGSLVAKPTTATTYGNGGGKSGIGGYLFGNIIINGGNITAEGCYGGAGIGGDQNNHNGGDTTLSNCGDITINGGVVNAKGSSSGNYSSAGIGGGIATWGDENNHYRGIFRTITINGGQVTADRIGNPSNRSRGTLVMGWTNLTDFIEATTYSASSISFTKQFLLDGTTTIATTSNINGNKIVPLRLNLADATISGLSNTYTYTGTPININYTVAYNGTTLTKDTDYSAQITKGGEVITEVKEVGEYTLTLTGKGNYTGTKSTTFRVEAINLTNASISGLNNTYTYTGTPININYTVAYNGTTLTAGTDYSAQITKGGAVVTEVKEVGEYTLTITGMVNYTGMKSTTFSVVALSLTNVSINGVEPTYYYTDTPIKISYTVTHGGTTLTKGTDYTAKITKGTGNTEVTSITEAGSYILTITGISNYTGSLTQGFEVIAIPELISGDFIVDGGQATNLTTSENYGSLVDGNVDTQYGLTNADPWVEFHYSCPIPVKGYVIWTADGQEGLSNPFSWTIKAKNEGDTEWTTLAEVDNNSYDKLPKANKVSTSFITNNQTANHSFKYFRFEATKRGDYRGFQLAELQFYTTTNFIRNLNNATVSGLKDIYVYTGNVIDISHSVRALDGTRLTKDTDYSVTYTKNGNTVSAVKDKGTYTMTFTGIGNYTGSQSFTFSVDNYLTIGSLNGIYSSGLPIDTQHEYCLTQQIYTTHELGVAGTIKSIAFYNESTVGSHNGHTRKLDIYMLHTDISSFGGENDWVPVNTTDDLVYSGDVTFLENNWTTITFTAPFVYDGQHNVVLVVFDKTGKSQLPHLMCHPFNTELTQTISHFGPLPEFSPTSPGRGSVESRKNILRLIKDELPTCIKPHDLTIDYAGGKTATLSWTGSGDAWQICLNDGNTDEIIDVTSNPFTLTGLGFATNYAIKMRTNCGDGDYSDWTNAINFATDFCERENMCNISFDLTSSLGYLWLGNAIEVVDAQTGFLLGRVANYATSSELYIPVTSHEVVLVPAGREINFRWVLGDDPEYCSWTVYDVNGDEIWSGDPSYKGSNGYTYYRKTGDILYTYTVDCTSNPYKMPTELTCTKVTGTTATLSWTEKGSATAWQICINDDENNLIRIATNPYTLTGLTPETTYTAKVRSYGSDGQSRWTQNISFLPSDKRHIGLPEDTKDNVPTRVRSSYSLTEQIYLAEELGSAGVFKSIDFYAKNYSSTRNLDIYMVHTDKSHFRIPNTSSHEWVSVTQADKVFSGDVTFTKDAWTTIELDIAFNYDGQHNVLLVVDDNTGSSYEYNYASLFSVYSSSLYVEEDGQTKYSSRTLYNSNGNLDPTNLSGVYKSDLSYSSEIRISVAKEGELLRPGFLTASGVTGHTATLSWHENGTATAWQICLNNDENHLIDVTTNPYTLTELIPETSYTVKVRSVIGNKYSEWSKSTIFLASDKRRIGSGNATEYYVPTGTFSSNYFSEQIYTSEEMGEAGVISSIDFFCQYNTDTRYLDVYMFHTDKNSFSNPSTDWITPTAADKVFSGNVSFSANTWVNLEFDNLFSYDGVSNVVLAVYDKTGRSSSGSPLIFLVYNGTGGNQSAYYTNYSGNPEEGISGGGLMQKKNQIRLSYATGSPVPRPKDVACTASTSTTATIGWTEQGTATAWQICLNGDDLHPIDATTNPFTLTGITPFEDFTVKVRAVSGNEYSDWSKTLRVEAGGKIQIGSGTYSDHMLPVYSYVAYSMSEQIYTPADIINAGGSSGSIVRIEYLNTAPEQTRNIDIYMTHTTTDNFSAPNDYIPVTQADKVFSGNVTFKSGTWTGIMLDKAFAYDGQSNIALVVDDNTGSAVGHEPVNGYTFTSNNGYQVVYRNGSTDIDPTVSNTTNSGGLSSYKNQIRLGITQPAVAGDVNGDGSVTIKDAIAVVNYILTNGHPTGNFVFSAADMNGDKEITISDAVAIVNMILTGE